MKKKLLISLSLIVLLSLVFRFTYYPKFEIVTGISAKNLCSCMFVSGLSQEEAEKIDLNFSLLWLASNSVDTKNKAVFSHVLGMHPKKAVYTEGRGCTLELDSNISVFNPKDGTQYADEIWPNEIVNGNAKMQAALQSAFDKPGETTLNTRAVLVIHNGEIVGEAYADGIDMDTPLLGWSMAKSITSTLAGVLAKDGMWQLASTLAIPEWKEDDRQNITLQNLLQMSSGLEWEENYKAVSTATKMLYNSNDMGAYAQSQKLAYPPGEQWLYSSGTTNIVARTMANAFRDLESYQQFPYERLFGPLGATSFVLETDASGHFMGSTYGYASARDWGKVGQLYLQEGNWNGTQIIDSSWVAFSQTAAPASAGEYGGHFLLNRGGKYESYDENAYWMSGFHGQQVAIHPDKDLVIVRLGVTYERGAFDFSGWSQAVFEAVK